MIDSPECGDTVADYSSPKHSDKKSLHGLTILGSSVTGAGCAVPILVIAAIFIGRWLDEQAGTAPWILLAMVLGSVILGLVTAILSALSAAKTAQEEYHRRKMSDGSSADVYGKD